MLAILVGVVISRKSGLPRAKSIGFAFAFLHFSLFTYIIALILSGREPDWPMYWLLFMGIDFPVSLLFILLGYVLGFLPFQQMTRFLPGVFGDFRNFILPALFFGIVGTWWWYTIPQLIAKAVRNPDRTAPGGGH